MAPRKAVKTQIVPVPNIQKLTPDQSRIEEYLSLRDQLIADQILSYETFQAALNRVSNLVRNLTGCGKQPTTVRANLAAKNGNGHGEVNGNGNGNGNGSAAKKTILSVAYDPNIATLESQGSLANAGYALKSVMSDWEAMAALLHSRIDLVVIGLFASATERQKLVTIIKSQHPHVRVIVLFTGANEFYPEADAVLSPSDNAGKLFYTITSLLACPCARAPKKAKYVVFVDVQGRYAEVSPAICRLLGYKRKELIGKMVDDTFHEKPRSGGWDDLYQQFMRQGFLHGRHVLRHKNGQPVNIQYQAQFLPSGKLMAEWFPATAYATAG
jgi:PAS domain S-box-containing protein